MTGKVSPSATATTLPVKVETWENMGTDRNSIIRRGRKSFA